MDVDRMRAGDTAIVYTGNMRELSPHVLVPGGEIQNQHGFFRHNDMIGKPFGSKIASSSRTLHGYITLLKLTPELWSLSLLHRTQILYYADIAMIVSRMGLRPGSVVVESGTGSGSLTHALARAVAPTGHVYTFEFNAHRAEAARKEFTSHGIATFVTVTHRDAVADGFTPEVQPHAADGVFLDLPNPWGAIRHAAAVLRPCGVLCSFSPCIEQISRTAREMERSGFEDLKCFETLIRPYEAVEGKMATPSSVDLSIVSVEQARTSEAAAKATASGKGAKTGVKRTRTGGQVWIPGIKAGAGAGAAAAPSSASTASASAPGMALPAVQLSTCGRGEGAGAGQAKVDMAVDALGEENDSVTGGEEEAGADAQSGAKRHRVAEDAPPEAAAGVPVQQVAISAGSRAEGKAGTSLPVLKPWPKLDPATLPTLVRPVRDTRGHTGYLIFATLYRIANAGSSSGIANAGSSSGSTGASTADIQ